MRTKHYMVNNLYLLDLHICHNLPIQHNLCSLLNHFLVTLLHDLWAPAHYQLHHAFPHLKFPYPKHLLPDLHLRTQRLRHPFLFQANERTLKLSSTCVFYISTDTHLNLAWNRTRSHGSCLTCKPAQLTPGTNTSWPRSLKKTLWYNTADELLEEIQ